MSEHAARTPRSTTTKLIIALFVGFLIAGAGAVFYLAKYGSEQSQTAQSEAGQKEQAQAGQAQEQGEKKDLAAQVKRACDAGGETARNLAKQGLCKKATEIVKEPPVKVQQGEPGKKGDKGDPAPPITDAQVYRAVVTYCANGRCDAKAPTPQQVASAVTSYCNARAQCTPPKPADGEDGEDGEDGTNGQNATAAQVATAVEGYCGQESLPCKSTTAGPIGPGGPEGPKGDTGAKGDSVRATIVAAQGGTTVALTYVNAAGDEVGSAGSFMIPDGPAGPQGPAGPPGPMCEAGSTPQKQQVVTIEAPTGIWIIACVLEDQNP